MSNVVTKPGLEAPEKEAEESELLTRSQRVVLLIRNQSHVGHQIRCMVFTPCPTGVQSQSLKGLFAAGKNFGSVEYSVA